MSQIASTKSDQLQQRFEADKKKAMQKLKDEINFKNDKIADMEKQIAKDKALREKAESSVK